MNPVVTGVVAALALVAVFTAGAMIDFDSGSGPVKVELGQQGPLEQVGEALDEAASK